MTAALDDRRRQIESFVRDNVGPAATVHDVEPMPGHAGLSFGFTVDHDGRRESFVLRVPPKGVRQKGNTDVLRQAPLLDALARNGVPVPRLRWSGPDTKWFEVPYLIVEKLPGAVFSQQEPDPSFGLSPASVHPLYEQAVSVLARIHQLDWRTDLAAWEEPRALEQEIRYWDPILAKSAEPGWIAEAERVRDQLLARLPDSPRVGLFHGDFHTANILYDRGRLVAVLDWEIAGIGAQLLDLGWLIMFNDPQCWAASARPIDAVPSSAELIATYQDAAGEPARDIVWFRALAGYRFGVISCFNVRLHRTGRRPDPHWELLAPSISPLFARSSQLLAGAR